MDKLYNPTVWNCFMCRWLNINHTEACTICGISKVTGDNYVSTKEYREVLNEKN